MKTDEYGNKYWHNENGQYHRDNNLPAIEYINGTKEWYVNGKLHRDNGPAIEFANGDKYWYMDGKLHRDNDLPAVENANGDKGWYVNGNLHRDNNKPAIIIGNGEVMGWYRRGVKYIPEGRQDDGSGNCVSGK